MILEYDCPVDGVDYDVEVPNDVRMLLPFYCYGCRQEHTAVEVAANILDDNGTFIVNARYPRGR